MPSTVRWSAVERQLQRFQGESAITSQRGVGVAAQEKRRCEPQVPVEGGATSLGERVAGFARKHPVATVFVLALVPRVILSSVIFVQFGGALFGDDLTYPTLAAQAATGESATAWDAYSRQLYYETFTLLAPLTALYRLFGGNILVGQLLIAVFGAGAAALTTRLAIEVLRTRWALLAGLIVAGLPSLVLWSSITMKDAVVWALLAAIAVVVAIYGRAEGWRLALLPMTVPVLFLLLRHVRMHSLVVAAWALAVASWFGVPRRRLLRGVVGLAVAVAVPWLLAMGPAGVGFMTSQLQERPLDQRRYINAEGAETAFVPPVYDLQRVQDLESTAGDLVQRARETEARADRSQAEADRLAQRADKAERAAEAAQAEPKPEAERRARKAAEQAERLRAEAAAVAEEAKRLRAESAALAVAAEQTRTEADDAVARQPQLDTWFGSGSDFERPSGFRSHIQHLPKGLSVMLLKPYPWQDTTNSRILFAKAETILWYPLLLLAVVGLASLRRYARVLVFPLVVAGGLAVGYALSEGNFGTAYRHRGEFVWAVAMFAACGAATVARWITTWRANASADA